MQAKWFDPRLDDSQWGTMRTDVKDKGYGKDMGVGWYRAQLPLIDRNRDAKFKYLCFGACDEQTSVYVNDKQRFSHMVNSTGLMPAKISLKPFVVPLNHVDVRGRDLVAVRVRNSENMGGIWKHVRLILSERELTPEHVKALIKLQITEE